MFENTILVVADSVGLTGAYFAAGTLWIPRTVENDAAFASFSEKLNDLIWVSKTPDEWAVDFTV